MSNRRKNNHYHYAEKFDDRRRRSASGRRVFVPFKSVIISLVVLLMFGLVCTTFSVYVTENQPDYDPSDPPLVVQARNIKASRDIAVTGANVDLASSGWNFSGVSFIFDNTNTGWSNDLTFQILIGKTGYSDSYDLTRLGDTQLYGYNGLNYTDETEFCIIAHSSHFGQDKTHSPSDRKGYATKYTNIIIPTSNYSGFYKANGAGTSNNTSLTFSSATGWSEFNLKQELQSSTKSSAGGSYSNSTTGGVINFSSVEVKSNTETKASVDHTGYFYAAKTATVTLTAVPKSGYRFVGWYDDTNTNQITGTGVNGATYTYTATSARKVYARFIKTYTVSVTKMSGYSGTSPSGGATVDAGQSVTINANVPTGVDFTEWTITGTYTGGSTSSASTTITPTSDVTATANYSLQAPTNLVLTYDTYKVLGYDSYAPNTSSAQTQTATGSGSELSYSYDIAQDESATVTLTKGTDYAVASSGAVTATVPGKYVVTMTVTDTCYGLTSTATTTATVEVRPVTPVFNYTVSGYTDTVIPGTTGTSADTPYKIPINNNHTSDFTITSGLAGIENYTYTWTTTDGTATATQSTTTASTNGNLITETVRDPETILHASTAANYTYTVSLVASYNGVSSGTASVTIYYTVTADFLQTKHFYLDETFDDPDTDEDESKTVQKIYATENNVSQICAAFNAGGQNFHTVLYFSSDNINFTPIQVFTDQPFTLKGRNYSAQPDDNTNHNTIRPYTVDSGTSYLIFNLPVIAQLANTGDTVELINVMKRSGVKYFKAYIDDFGNGNVTAAEPTLHTTVGTSSTGGARPVYFKESTSNTFPNSRLMAYFLDSSGEMTYQTAADYNSVVTQIDDARTDRTGIYRFYAPSDAVSVCFAYSSTNSYVLPYKTGEGDALGFGSDPSVFMAYTDIITLDSKYNMYKANASTSDTNGIMHYTGAWTKLDMDS